MTAAWPWPKEPATNPHGFIAVVKAVEHIVQAREFVAWERGYLQSAHDGETEAEKADNPYEAGL